MLFDKNKSLTLFPQPTTSTFLYRLSLPHSFANFVRRACHDREVGQVESLGGVGSVTTSGFEPFVLGKLILPKLRELLGAFGISWQLRTRGTGGIVGQAQQCMRKFKHDVTEQAVKLTAAFLAPDGFVLSETETAAQEMSRMRSTVELVGSF